jgi:flavin-dependent dehydrogenase
MSNEQISPDEEPGKVPIFGRSEKVSPFGGLGGTGKPHDIIIIGAGPAGSSVAHLLAGRGWDVVLLEQHHFPRHKVCGEFLSPEAQSSLRAMGLYEVVDALSPAPIEQARLVSPAGLAAPMALPGQAWGVSRFALDAALAAAAQKEGAYLHFGVTATEITRTDKGFEVGLRSKSGPATLRARTVLAACGRHSGPALPPKAASGRPAYVGLKGHYEGVTMPPHVELFFFPGGYAGICPIEGGRINLCMLASPTTLAQAGKGVGAMLAWAIRQNPRLVRRLTGGRLLPETAVAVAPVDTHRSAAPWAGLACLGDAAVMIPPLCGDGMAMALRSAELCAPLAHDFLAGRLSLEAWVAAYCSAWRAEFGRAIRLGRYLQTLLSAPILSGALLGLGRLFPPLAETLVRATRSGGYVPK